jgi:hypothetical protein
VALLSVADEALRPSSALLLLSATLLFADGGCGAPSLS